MPSNSTPPTQEPFYVGINLHEILYGEFGRTHDVRLTGPLSGIELCFYFKTMHIFLTRGRVRHKSDMLFGVFSAVMFFLVTIYVAILGIFGQEIWVPDQKYPDGPPYRYIDVVAVAAIILQQMTDGLMVRPRQ